MSNLENKLNETNKRIDSAITDIDSKSFDRYRLSQEAPAENGEAESGDAKENFFR